jgi:hypothetical protein
MKRLFITLGLFVTVFSTSSFASGTSEYPIFLESFFKTFDGVKNVNWSEVNGCVRIAFMRDGKQNYAYYNSDNELIVVSTQMELKELPASLQSALQTKYRDFTVTGVYTFTTGNKAEYFVSLDNYKKQLVLNSGGKKWSLFSSKKK